MEERIVTNIRRYKVGYEIRTEKVLSHFEDMPKDHRVTMKIAYTDEGDYIGDTKTAHFLMVTKGIKPERKRKDISICSIGFCEDEQKWYGWSHRAISGFGVGDTVKKGDCAYQATNKEDFLQQMKDFWMHEEDEYATRSVCVNNILDVHNPEEDTSKMGILIETEYVRKRNDEVVFSKYWHPYPNEWGKGEWAAKTLADAKAMAIAFADAVA